MRVQMPQAQQICTLQGASKNDLFLVDGGATANGTYDRNLCTNIRFRNFTICGANANESFSCHEMGDMLIHVRAGPYHK
jgi:hypothetical protein